MTPPRVPRPDPSRRIRQTTSPVIDDVIATYANEVQFNLAPGATYFGMSSQVRAKMIALLDDPHQSRHLSNYADVLGSPRLRTLWANTIIRGYDAICPSPDATNGTVSEDLLQSEQHVIPRQELMITAGANQAFVNVILATCDACDQVLLILPYYFSHFNALVMTGVIPVLVPVEKETLQPKLADIAERITPRTTALVVVNPGNPSGKVFPKAVMEGMRDLCSRSGIWLIIDEAYREFVHEGESRIAYSPTNADNVVRIFTASKAYGLAGWRIGAVLYPKRLSAEMRKAQDTIPTHACRFSEHVAYESLLTNPLRETTALPCNITLVGKVRKTFIAFLKPVYENTAFEGDFVIPDGAFYFFLPYRKTLANAQDGERDDMEAVDFLALKHGVLLVPGFAFGMAGYLRASYGCIEVDRAAAAASRLAKGMREVLQR